MIGRWKKAGAAAALLLGFLIIFHAGGIISFAEPEESTVEAGPGTQEAYSLEGPGVSPLPSAQSGPGIVKPAQTSGEQAVGGSADAAAGIDPKAKYLNTIVDSAGISIYVSKLKNKVTLFRNGIIMNVWDCNMGTYSALGDKQREGDRITPSGKFYICTRNPYSVCHLSLGLSYPSGDDADRGFQEGLITEEQRDAIKTAIAKGEAPPWDTPLGGEIMIHGGYQPNQPTRGCVALPNDVMDYLWNYAGLGVPVEIGP